MNKWILLLFVLPSLSATAQTRQHIFLSAELHKTYGLSSAYSRVLRGTNFGVGASVDIIDIRSQRLGGIMPSLDLRYYKTWGRSTLIPLAQAGYNFYRFDYTKPGTSEQYSVSGGYSFSLGLGYAYALNAKGAGPYFALKYRSLQYRQTDPALPFRSSVAQPRISIGWKF